MAAAPDERPKPDRTIVRVMVRPRWIAMLLLAIAIAGAFAWLGHWQLERAVVPAADTAEVSEIARPIGEAQTPGKPMYDTSIGQTVTAEGRYVPGDFSVITERVQDGRTGYWVAAHFEQKAGSEGTTGSEGAAIAVAVGWTDSEEVAKDAAAELNAQPAASEDVTVTGRLIPGQAPETAEDGDPNVLNTMAVSALINRWQDMTGHDVYGGYVIAGDPAEVGQVDGLVAIDAPPPVPETTVNWLNIFYAVEWVVFAGFAVFLWYRLVRDTWEREYEEKLMASGAGPEPVRVD